MIISDEHRLAFVHIPKCAGVSVKNPLHAIDSTQGQFSRIGDHPAMGRIHFAHIPLRDLAEHFPEQSAKLRSYRTFAVVRSPTDRFLSALFQRMREFKNVQQSEITPDRVRTEAAEVIRYLETNPDRLDLEHVHFNRQADYIFHAGERVVNDLFPIENMAQLVTYVSEHASLTVEEERHNRSTEIRFAALLPFVRALRRPYAMLVPYAVRNHIRDRMVRGGIYGNVNTRAMIRQGDAVDGFIKAYYARDFEIHADSL